MSVFADLLVAVEFQSPCLGDRERGTIGVDRETETEQELVQQSRMSGH